MQTPARGKPLGVLTYWVVAMLAVTAVIDIFGVVSLDDRAFAGAGSRSPRRPVSTRGSGRERPTASRRLGGWTCDRGCSSPGCCGVSGSTARTRTSGRVSRSRPRGTTPGWAVGLVVRPVREPLEALRAPCRSSGKPASPTDDPPRLVACQGLVGCWRLWWACWIGGNLLRCRGEFAMQRESDLEHRGVERHRRGDRAPGGDHGRASARS